MIQLQSQRILIKNSAGQREPLALTEVETALDRALQTCGIKESWLVDHLLVALQDYAAVMADGKEAMEGKLLHQTLARMLMDAGYADVAACFARNCRIAEPLLTVAERSPWQPERIARVLGCQLPPGYFDPNLARQVAGQLEKLGFARVTDTMIVEIARHIMVEWGERERNQEETDRREEWLLAPGFWQTSLDLETVSLLEDKIIDIRPFSELLPVVRVSLSLPRLVEHQQSKPLTDLVLLPLVAHTAALLARTIDSLVEQLARRRENRQYRQPAHLSVTGLDAMLNAEFPQANKGEIARRRSEIIDVMSRILENRMQHRLILTF